MNYLKFKTLPNISFQILLFYTKINIYYIDLLHRYVVAYNKKNRNKTGTNLFHIWNKFVTNLKSNLKWKFLKTKYREMLHFLKYIPTNINWIKFKLFIFGVKLKIHALNTANLPIKYDKFLAISSNLNNLFAKFVVKITYMCEFFTKYRKFDIYIIDIWYNF